MGSTELNEVCWVWMRRTLFPPTGQWIRYLLKSIFSNPLGIGDYWEPWLKFKSRIEKSFLIIDHLAWTPQRPNQTQSNGRSPVFQMQRAAAVGAFASKICAAKCKHPNIFIESVWERQLCPRCDQSSFCRVSAAWWSGVLRRNAVQVLVESLISVNQT